MRVAVAGSGFAGLATVWHLLQKGASVTLFDPKGIAGGASGVSTGLMHPFPGKKALRSEKSEEGMKAANQLLSIAEKALGRSVALHTGIFRPAISEQQKTDFFLRAQEDLEAEWREISLPDAPPLSGLWIPRGVTVFSRLYLEGLWLACQQQGAIFENKPLSGPFDATILATGAETLRFASCSHLPLKTAIGQTLLCRWPKPLPFSLVSQGHITPTEDPYLCHIGSTYEHTPAPDPKKALELLDKAALFYPPAKHYSILEIRSGTRIAPREGYLPITTQIAPKTWLFTGLGSRGLLYHAFFAHSLVQEILK